MRKAGQGISRTGWEVQGIIVDLGVGGKGEVEREAKRKTKGKIKRKIKRQHEEVKSQTKDTCDLKPKSPVRK